MTEKQEAFDIANAVLNSPSLDPDGDTSVLARQFLRAREEIDAMREALKRAREPLGKIRIEHRSHITIGPFATEPYAHIKITSDHWPVVDAWQVTIEFAVGAIDHVLTNFTVPSNAPTTPRDKGRSAGQS